MGISFFKVPNHRVFHYEPRYWDERKERREMVNRRGSLSKNLTRIIGLVSVATFLALLYFFAKYATIVLEGIR